MRFGSVCSGIEAASVAFGPLGWKAAWLAEIEPFPSAVLAHHYPDVPNLGDMTRIAATIDSGQIEAPDMLCGGTPCQSFSVAGLRRSLDDARGNLSLEFIRIADAIDRVRCAAGKQPAYVLWENVPGVLSTKDNAFGAFLGGLCGSDAAIDAPADGWPSAGVVDGPARVVAWRTLDAQFFGLAQRRKRVFVLALGGAGRWTCADALLPITESLCGHPAPRREAREGTAGRAARSIAIRGRDGTPQAELGDELANALLTPNGGRGGVGVGAVLAPERARALTTSNQRIDAETETFVVTHALTGEGFDASEDGSGRGTPLVPISIQGSMLGRADHAGPAGSGISDSGLSFTLTKTDVHAVAFDTTQITSKANYSNPQPGDPCHPLAAGAHPPAIAGTLTSNGDAHSGFKDENGLVHCAMQVRRLTPEECEALQGFKRGYTAIPYRGKPAADGPRYKALGNSWAVPCAAWIGRRIALVDSIGGNEARAAV